MGFKSSTGRAIYRGYIRDQIRVSAKVNVITKLGVRQRCGLLPNYSENSLFIFATVVVCSVENVCNVLQFEGFDTVARTVLETVSKPLVLRHCWLGVRKIIRPVKIQWWGVGVVIFLEQRADCSHMCGPANATAKPHHLLPHLNPD